MMKLQLFRKIDSEINRATIKSMNRAATSAVAQSVRWVRERFNIKASDLKKQIKIIKATIKNPVITLIFNKKPISYTYFKHKETKKGVVVSVIKRQRQLLRSKDGKRGSFVWNDSAGDENIKRGVFIRTGIKREMKRGKYKGKVRETIKKLFGPQAQQLMTSETGLDILETAFHERFNVEFNREVEYRISKLN